MTEQNKPAIRNTSSGVDSTFRWMRQEMERFFDELGRTRLPFMGLRGNGLHPRVELVEREADYCLTAEVPGVDQNQVEVSIAGDTLILSGQKQEVRDSESMGFMFHERRYGAFERRVPLPENIDPDNIEAHFDNGVLTVVIAKDRVTPSAKKIPISAT